MLRTDGSVACSYRGVLPCQKDKPHLCDNIVPANFVSHIWIHCKLGLVKSSSLKFGIYT
jgi:hypothetical protein